MSWTEGEYRYSMPLNRAKRMETMKKRFFNSKDLSLMSLMGALSSLVGLTTAFIPAPLPGLYAAISIPVGTILLLITREFVGKTGAATFTQFVSGAISTMLPGGPPVIFIIVPTWVLGGMVVDLFFLIRQRISNSRLAFGFAGFIYTIPGDLLLFWAFNFFLGWSWPFPFFLYGFLAIHSFLGALAGVFMPEILAKIKVGFD